MLFTKLKSGWRHIQYTFSRLPSPDILTQSPNSYSFHNSQLISTQTVDYETYKQTPHRVTVLATSSISARRGAQHHHLHLSPPRYTPPPSSRLRLLHSFISSFHLIKHALRQYMHSHIHYTPLQSPCKSCNVYYIISSCLRQEPTAPPTPPLPT